MVPLAIDQPDHPPTAPAARVEPDDPDPSALAVGGALPERVSIALEAGEVVPIRRGHAPEVLEQVGGPVDELRLLRGVLW